MDTQCDFLPQDRPGRITPLEQLLVFSKSGKKTAELVDYYIQYPKWFANLIDEWYTECACAIEDATNGLEAGTKSGTFAATQIIQLYCDLYHQSLNADCVTQLFNQIFAWELKGHCTIACGGIIVRNKCQRCGATEIISPELSTPEEMQRTLSKAYWLKTRLEKILHLKSDSLNATKFTEPTPRLKLNLADNQAVFDGTPYKLTLKQTEILQALLDANGEYVSLADNGWRSRDILSFPEAIQAIIESQSGAGTRLKPLRP